MLRPGQTLLTRKVAEDVTVALLGHAGGEVESLPNVFMLPACLIRLMALGARRVAARGAERSEPRPKVGPAEGSSTVLPGAPAAAGS